MSELSVAIAEAYKRGNKVLICGNGGLAAESEHFAAELMGKYGRDLFIPCFALTTNTSLVTAIANDYGFENIFYHQVKALGKKGDILIGMTTSASENVVRAIDIGFDLDLITVLVCSENWPSANYQQLYRTPGTGTAEIQNNIIKFLHQVALEAKELAIEDAVRQS